MSFISSNLLANRIIGAAVGWETVGGQDLSHPHPHGMGDRRGTVPLSPPPPMGWETGGGQDLSHPTPHGMGDRRGTGPLPPPPPWDGRQEGDRTSPTPTPMGWETGGGQDLSHPHPHGMGDSRGAVPLPPPPLIQLSPIWYHTHIACTIRGSHREEDLLTLADDKCNFKRKINMFVNTWGNPTHVRVQTPPTK